MDFQNRIAHSNINYNNEQMKILLISVVRGDMEGVKKILLSNKELIYVQASVVDLSNRLFENITIFQYAVWALDVPMWELILEYLPLPDAARQLFVLENNLNNKHGLHFNFDKLRSVMRECVSEHNNYPNRYKSKKHWCQGIGGEQRNVPAWVVFMWCEKGAEIAWVKKNFTTPYQRDPELLTMWFEEKFMGGKLGETWAVSRGTLVKSSYFRSQGIDGHSINRADNDCSVLLGLSGYAEEQLNKLKIKLNEHLPNNYRLYY